MDYNGMTEEEYLDSLLKQTSDDIPKDEPLEQKETSDEVSENTEETVEDIAFDFNSIFENIAEAESAPAESHEEESEEEPEEDFLEAFFSQMEEKALEEAVEEAAEASEPESKDFGFDTVSAEPEAIDFGFDMFKAEPEEETKYDDFHESLDSIIGELEKEREEAEPEDIDIFSQIDNAQFSEEELSQDIDDMALMEAVGILLDEDSNNREKNADMSAFAGFDDEAKENTKDKKREKKSFLKRFKAFLVEQGEDTDEDIAAAAAADLAKEEKLQKAEEEKEKKAQAKAEKKEKAEQKKAAKKEAKENKALERQMKREQKKAEREASGEPKYNVTTVKLALLFTLVAAFGILLWAISDFNFRRISKKNAMIYFTADQYELAYEEIAGLEPRKSEQVFFEQVRTVMYVQKQYDSYLNFYNIGMKEEALNALLKGIDKYDKYYENADDLGILEDMNIVLDKIHTALDETFYLSADKAAAIANIEDAAEYSVALRQVINSIKE